VGGAAGGDLIAASPGAFCGAPYSDVNFAFHNVNHD